MVSRARRTVAAALLVAVACASAATSVTETLEKVTVSTPEYQLEVPRGGRPPKVTVYLKNVKKDKYRLELAHIFEADATNSSNVKTIPMTNTIPSLLFWNVSRATAVTNSEMGGTLAITFAASGLPNSTASGTGTGKTYRFTGITFTLLVHLHENENYDKMAGSAFPVVSMGAEVAGYRWQEKPPTASFAFAWRFYLNEQEYLTPTATREGEDLTASVTFGNLYFKIDKAVALTSLPGGSALTVRIWAVPWTSIKSVTSTLWVVYGGCTVQEGTIIAPSDMICGISHKVGGIVVGFATIKRDSDKAYIAIIVLTLLALVVLIALIGRYLYKKAKKRQTFYRLWSHLSIGSKRSMGSPDTFRGDPDSPALNLVPAKSRRIVVGQADMLPVNVRDLDD